MTADDPPGVESSVDSDDGSLSVSFSIDVAELFGASADDEERD